MKSLITSFLMVTAFASCTFASSIFFNEDLIFTVKENSYPSFSYQPTQKNIKFCSLFGYIGDKNVKVVDNMVRLPKTTPNKIWHVQENKYFYDSDGDANRYYITSIQAVLEGFENSYITATCRVPAEKGILPFSWKAIAPVPTLVELQAMFADRFKVVD